MEIALIGNPNTGKTTLFNNLTDSYATVGNWPGVTVNPKAGRLKGTATDLIDRLNRPPRGLCPNAVNQR